MHMCHMAAVYPRGNIVKQICSKSFDMFFTLATVPMRSIYPKLIFSGHKETVVKPRIVFI